MSACLCASGIFSHHHHHLCALFTFFSSFAMNFLRSSTPILNQIFDIELNNKLNTEEQTVEQKKNNYRHGKEKESRIFNFLSVFLEFFFGSFIHKKKQKACYSIN